MLDAVIVTGCFWLCSGARNRPVKTLEEREAAYAEARLRILGSAPESDAQTTANTRSNKSVLSVLPRNAL